MEDRVFTDTLAAQFIAKIQASAAKKGCACKWVRSSHIGPTGNPYIYRRLAIVERWEEGEKVLFVARCNRRGSVRWHTPWSCETFEVEDGEIA